MAAKTALTRNNRRKFSNGSNGIRRILLEELQRRGFEDVKIVSHSAQHRGQLILYVIAEDFNDMAWIDRQELVWGILEKEMNARSLEGIAHCFTWTPQESIPRFRSAG
jgi:stress-induced morphogen